jgi:hypothetical protein
MSTDNELSDQEWPAVSSYVRNRVSIDFGIDPRDVARQDAKTFIAIRPIGLEYEYR